MKRISGHEIDHALLDALEPHPFRINFYVDGYGAKLNAEKLYDIGDQALEKHLRDQSELQNTDPVPLYNHFYAPPAAPVFAEILSYCLAFTEMAVVSRIEERAAKVGKPFFPNALLINQSNSVNINLDVISGNILEALYPLSEEEFCAGRYLDVSSDGIIYSTGKIDREGEKAKLRRDIERNNRGDPLYLEWLKTNLASLDNGVFHYRNRDGTVGKPINFEFSERFFDEVADRIGYYSRWGKSKVHWRSGLSDFGEKGVDCDLIMQVMDDLHGGEVDAFVFMTNDMDFFPLMERLRLEGKHVFLCGREGHVSQKLIQTVGREAFFNLLDDAVVKNLPSVFMSMKNPEFRNLSLQWAWLALKNSQ